MKDLKFNQNYTLPVKSYSYTIEAFNSAAMNDSEDDEEDTCEEDSVYNSYYKGGIPTKFTEKKSKNKDEKKIDNSFLIFVDVGDSITIKIVSLAIGSYNVTVTKKNQRSNQPATYNCYIAKENFNKLGLVSST
jgi:hypothetical protein